MKCLQYWPDKEGEQLQFAEFTIVNMGVEEWPDYSITQLKLCMVRFSRTQSIYYREANTSMELSSLPRVCLFIIFKYCFCNAFSIYLNVKRK